MIGRLGVRNTSASLRFTVPKSLKLSINFIRNFEKSTSYNNGLAVCFLGRSDELSQTRQTDSTLSLFTQIHVKLTIEQILFEYIRKNSGDSQSDNMVNDLNHAEIADAFSRVL